MPLTACKVRKEPRPDRPDENLSEMDHLDMERDCGIHEQSKAMEWVVEASGAVTDRIVVDALEQQDLAAAQGK